MNQLDDFICEIQSDELYDENLAEDEFPQPRSMGVRRKIDWHHAKHNYRVIHEEFLKAWKPLHYYSKTKPEFYYNRTNKTNNKGKHRTAYGNYNPSKNWSVSDKRKIQQGENQIKELFDEE